MHTYMGILPVGSAHGWSLCFYAQIVINRGICLPRRLIARPCMLSLTVRMTMQDLWKDRQLLGRLPLSIVCYTWPLAGDYFFVYLPMWVLFVKALSWLFRSWSLFVSSISWACSEKPMKPYACLLVMYRSPMFVYWWCIEAVCLCMLMMYRSPMSVYWWCIEALCLCALMMMYRSPMFVYADDV